MAKKVRLEWQKLRVHKSESYGLTGEAGSEAEWFLKLQVRVNGIVRAEIPFDRDVRDRRSYDINRSVEVDLDGPLSLTVWGFEDDDSSGNDDLPGLDVPHAVDPRWDQGPVAYEQSSHDAAVHFDDTIHYTIETVSHFGGVLTPAQGTLFDTRFSGLWDAGSQRTVWSTGLTAQQLNAQAGDLWGQGGRLAQLQAYVLGGREVRYNVIWTFTGIGQLWNIDCDEAHFLATTGDTWSWARPHSVCPFVVNGHLRYAVLWNAGQHRQRWHHNTDDAGFRAITGETWSWARPHQVYAFVLGGQVRYSCLWNAGQHGLLWHPNCSENDAVKIAGDNWSWGRSHQVQPFLPNGQRRYSVLWKSGQHGQLWNFNLTAAQVAANSADTHSWARPRQLLAPPG